ncbi:MFS family permease [Streptomyces sp. V4I23]|uniref:hypothetical protein n=1 Tax=Streptomyces sp. V4I23 TaxID=3042282 RepID=UPI002781DBF8|nr:hypothetical protein [Streptomyces sp. V4I23]MDQ1006999.1 MFS family permease [Streptomyces sp. V4I23]
MSIRQPTERPVRTPASVNRVTSAALVGTVIEFYDFALYATAAAIVFGPVFFPGFAPAAATPAAFGTFATGFVARPLGSVLFGHIGDRLGRRVVLQSPVHSPPIPSPWTKRRTTRQTGAATPSSR